MKLIEANKVEQAIKDYWKAHVDRLPIPKSIEEHDAYANRLDTILEYNSDLLKVIDELPSAEQDTTTHDSIPAETGKNDEDRTSGDCISRTQAIDKFIDGLEEIFADLRERHVDDSVCGLCEYDGAYIGQSGDWCNECPGFDRDDCFKLSDKTRKKWTDEIIKALPPAQPEIIRCKDCKYYKFGICMKIGANKSFYGFCDWAERGEQNE